MHTNLAEIRSKLNSFPESGHCLPGEIPPTENTINSAFFWAKMGIDLNLGVDVVIGTENSVTVVFEYKDTHLFANLSVSEDSLEYIEVRQGFGLDYKTIDDIDEPEPREVIAILFRLSEGEVKQKRNTRHARCNKSPAIR